MLIPRVALSTNTDVTTIPSPANSLVVYNTNAAMTNGNGVGFYYWDASANKWMYMATAQNGPGNPGDVLKSNGPGNQPTWGPITSGSSGGGGGNVTGVSGMDTTCSNWTLFEVVNATYVGTGTYCSSPIPAGKEVFISINF
ncbi:MAG: hypothetical protein KatS3mg028_1081 [Bacteroidia bacterium]|nr:MAG: hypothetical protein KatS3mg028_1081 [Bacteroidia bacterium]